MEVAVVVVVETKIAAVDVVECGYYLAQGRMKTDEAGIAGSKYEAASLVGRVINRDER